MALDEAQEHRVLIGHARDHHLDSGRAGEERLEVALEDRPFLAGNRVAVRVGLGMAKHLVDAIEQPIGNNVFEVFGVIVDLVPAHAHDLHQEQFDQAMPA